METTLEHSPSGSGVDENNDLHSQTVKRGINWIFAIAVIGFHLGKLCTGA